MIVYISSINPSYFGLDVLDDCIIVTSSNKCNSINVLQVENFNLEDITNILNNNCIKPSNIVAHHEPDIILCGELNDYYNLSNMTLCISEKYRDKLIMRRSLKDIILQPNFYTKDTFNLDLLDDFNYLYKPRSLMGSMGIGSLTKENFNEIDDSYIIEEYIDGSKMYSCEGIYFNNELHYFLIHEYSSPLLDDLENSNFTFVLPSKYNSESRYNEFYDQTLKIIKNLSPSSKLPFHIEFLEKDTKLYFIEVGARFGGALIPQILNATYDTNILRAYHDIIKSSEIKTSKIKGIYMSALAFKKDGVLHDYIKQNSSSVYFKNYGELNVKYSNSTHSSDSVYQEVIEVSCYEDVSKKIREFKEAVNLVFY